MHKNMIILAALFAPFTAPAQGQEKMTGCLFRSRANRGAELEQCSCALL
jgi:hypothetical protein